MNDVRKLFERTRIAVTSTEKCTSRRGTMIECNGSEMKRGAAIERLLLLRRHPDEPSLTPADTKKSLCTLGFENAATSRRLRRGLVRAAN